MRASAIAIARTVISLRVSVPVLSEQMTVAAPSVSTAGSLRTIAWAAAMRRTPRLKPTVTIAGSASGMAATASATANRNRLSTTLSVKVVVLRRPAANTAAQIAEHDHAEPLAGSVQFLLQRRRLFFGGVQQPGDPADLGLPCR